jgi:AraC-like DNA-binding protein
MLLYAVAVMDRLCKISGAPSPEITRVDLFPHPEHGLRHLSGWLNGTEFVPTRARATSVFLPSATAQRTFPRVGRDRLDSLPLENLSPLIGDGTFAGSIRIILPEMFEDGVPTIEQIALACDTSVRSVQRRLHEEGTSFRKLLDEVRRDLALRQLSGEKDAIGAVSIDVGYSRQASFTRAMHRWVGRSPREFRSTSS